MKFKVLAALLSGVFLLVSAAVLPALAGEGPAVDPAQVQGLQERMLGNPEIVTVILALQDDPEMQALLADPAVAAAVAAGDFKRLVNDPRFLKLLNKEEVKGIERQLRQEK